MVEDEDLNALKVMGDDCRHTSEFVSYRLLYRLFRGPLLDTSVPVMSPIHASEYLLRSKLMTPYGSSLTRELRD